MDNRMAAWLLVQLYGLAWPLFYDEQGEDRSSVYAEAVAKAAAALLKEEEQPSGTPADKIPPSGTLSLREAENGKE